MFENITIGQYIPGKSWIYRLDPRVKIFLIVALVVLLFLLPNVYFMLGALVFFFLLLLSTGLPVFKVIKGLKPVLYMVIFTFVLQTIYNKGTEETLVHTFSMQLSLYAILLMIVLVMFYNFTKKHIPFRFVYFLILLAGLFSIMVYFRTNQLVIKNFNYKIYEEGLTKGVYIFVRIIIMIGITSLLTFTTMSTDINNGVEGLLAPLKYLKFPVSTLSMMISLTLRFIPTLVEETQKILKAQSSRGVDFSEGNFKQKINQIISLLVPMFVTSFKKADDLANAMEARGYVIGAKRSKLDELKLKAVDYVSMFFYCILLAGVIVGRIYF